MNPRQLWLILGIATIVAVPSCGEELAEPTSIPVVEIGPRLRLRVSGNLEGYLMPCGCSANQLGGLARRQFRNKLDGHRIDLLLEGGNLIKQAGVLESSKLMTTLEILDQAGYQAIGLAGADLDMAQEGYDLDLLLASFVPVVASDLLLADGKPWLLGDDPVVHAYREVSFENATVRVASLVMSLPEAEVADQFSLLEPATAWQLAMEGVAEETLRVLMVHASADTIKQLDLSPAPDLLIGVNSDFVDPPLAANSVSGVPFVYSGTHGRFLLDLELTRTTTGSSLPRYTPIALEGSVTDPSAMRDADALAVIQSHREFVKQDQLREKLASVQTLPDGLRYVGAKSCADCHEDDSEKCADHLHSRAWQTLIDAEREENWPVTFYPECISCHVVGYGFKSGFVSPEKTPGLLNVTCENCHGPGSKHVDSGADEQVPIPRPGVKDCITCHNSEHSTNFDYTVYWPKIKHGK